MAHKNFLQKATAVLLALLVWQAAAAIINESILLVSPIDVIKRLGLLATKAKFWITILYTLRRIAHGFILGLGVGIILAALATKLHFVKNLLWPYVITIKSVPVASFIVIALIWLSSSNLSVFITFLMVFPIIYTNLLSGVENTDKKLIQMAEIYKLSPTKRLLYITLPQVKPYIISASSVAIGLAWKSGVAAEIIAIPQGSLGEALYQAKVHFDTNDLFAWTVAIVFLSILFEKLFLLLINLFYKRIEKL